MKKRIFVVDDEPDMVKIATDLLESDNYAVASSIHPIDALKRLRQSPPDLVILDVRLPDMDGLAVLRELRGDPKTKNIAAIIVSVKAEEADVVSGLEMGADDYITKPFRRQELLARVKTVLRRRETTPAAERLESGPIVLDFGSYSALLGKKPLILTPKEFELLGYFMKMEGRLLTRGAISEAVWSTEFTGSSRTIDVHVDQLRRKLGKYAECIKSLKGIGYRFEMD